MTDVSAASCILPAAGDLNCTPARSACIRGRYGQPTASVRIRPRDGFYSVARSIVCVTILTPRVITHRGIWGRSPLLLMSLVEELCVLPELTAWSCLQSDWLPSAAELFRLPLPTPGTLFLNIPSQLLRCSHLSVI